MIFGSSLRAVVKKHISSKKTGKKLSGKMNFNILMQLTELHVSLQWSVCEHSFLEICNGILLRAMKLSVTKEIYSDEN